MRVRRQYKAVMIMTAFLLVLTGSFAVAAPLAQKEAIDQQWLTKEIDKTQTALHKETDPEKKLKLLNYLEKLAQLQQDQQKESAASEGDWATIDFNINNAKTYLDYNPVGGWADGRYELKGIKFVKTNKKNIWELNLGFIMQKKGWQQYKKAVKCLVHYDGRLIQIKDEKGQKYSLNVNHKDPEIVVSKDPDGNKRITKEPMTKAINFDVFSGNVHMVLEF